MRSAAVALLTATLLIAVLTPAVAPAAEPGQPLELRLRPLPEGVRRVSLESDVNGRSLFLLERDDGTLERVKPDALAQLLLDEGRRRDLLHRFLNITSTAGLVWVGLGLLGQVLFTGRMLLQWWVSEREKRSVVPLGFWWMSLVGATMLLVYFTWRQDVVGVLGQCAGWVVYLRNLWLIYRERRLATGEPAAA